MKPIDRSATILASESELKAKIAKATAAAGLSELELMQALSIAVPINEIEDAASLTAQHSVLEVGESIYAKLSREPSKRGFYDRLTKDQQAMLVVYLVHAGFAPATIALQLSVSEEFVLKTWDNYADKIGQHVTGVRLDTVVGNLKLRADQIYQLAIRAGNYSLAWKVTRDLLECLQELNIVERAVQKQHVTHTYELNEAQLQELDEMMQLRAKRDAARQRIQVELDRPVTDPVPVVESTSPEVGSEHEGL